jgi:hypothetical protein
MRDVNAAPAEYPESAPNAPRYPRDCRTGARACPTAAASPPIIPAATPLPAVSAAVQSRRRSSGTHCEAWSRRSPHRRCIQRCRCALPLNSAAGPCRNIRSSAGVAAPWWSRLFRARGSWQIGGPIRMANLPRFRTSIRGKAPIHRARRLEGAASTRSRVPDALQRSSRCDAEPGPRLTMGPGSAAHRYTLRCVRGTMLIPVPTPRCPTFASDSRYPPSPARGSPTACAKSVAPARAG